MSSYRDSNLTAVLREAIGNEALARLLSEFGGTSLRVPMKPRPNWKAAECLGPEAYRKLVSLFQGEAFYVPFPRRERTYLRNANILKDRENGSRIIDLVRKYGITAVSLHRIIRDARKVRARERAAKVEHPEALPTSGGPSQGTRPPVSF